MAARFARMTDILTRSIFRAIIAAEFADMQRFLDVLNFMEKLKIIDSARQ
ncbi:hypothetical protein [Candidatus Nitrosacidococcus tergens]|uniref:Uncharacterized protein n=1 Tax=Candidatus Nitrosacidococcus tergens TaxID=553981 RepID=A0A7G1Q9A3_9GAMM|nr:hypothetical protein [Candidatus Nitrosacidococcus tergens]CAB1275803.1 conserved protein of unknown function [Candidatus Nitrosacidococcus tergens]